MVSVRGNIGLKRIPKTTGSSVAGNTRAIRSQLKILMSNMNKVIDRIEVITPDALVHGLLPTYRKSLKLVPKDTMKLHDSSYIQTGVVQGRPTAEIGFAKGGDPDYAVIVHEVVDVHHDSPTQAKFLENAYAAHSNNIPRRVRDFIKRGIGDK